MGASFLTDLTAERAILGAIMLYPEELDGVFLQAKDFAVEEHQAIFEAIIVLADKGTPPDMVNVSSALKGRIPPSTLNTMVGEGFMPSLVPYYCRTVRKLATSRKLANVCREIQANIQDDNALDMAEAKIMEIREDSGAQQTAVSVRATLGGVFKDLERLNSQKSHVAGMPTGYAELDVMTAGLQSADLIFLAGRPSMGKTALALNIVENSGGKCLFFSLEMGKEQLVKRLLSTVGKVDGQRIRTGQFMDDDWSNMTNAAGKIQNMPVWIDDSYHLSVMDLRAKARRHKRQHGLDLIVVDYLQLMAMPKAESRNLAVGEICRRLKGLAKELNVPIICLSQLSRDLERRADKRPLMADLRDSGSIEQDADVVLFPYRESVYCEACKAGTCTIKEHDRRAELIVAKQRNGPTGTVKLVWSPEYSQFQGLEHYRNANGGNHGLQ